MNAENTQSHKKKPNDQYDNPARLRKGSGDLIRAALPANITFADAPGVLVAGWALLTKEQKYKALENPARPGVPARSHRKAKSA